MGLAGSPNSASCVVTRLPLEVSEAIPAWSVFNNTGVIGCVVFILAGRWTELRIPSRPARQRFESAWRCTQTSTLVITLALVGYCPSGASMARSSSGLGCRTLDAETWVQIPYGLYRLVSGMLQSVSKTDLREVRVLPSLLEVELLAR